MKKKITKLLFALSIVLAFAFNVSSQDVSSPCFAKTHEELAGFRPSGMSDNGRFLICNAGRGTLGNTCKLWDTQTNTVTTIGTNCWGRDVSDDGKVVVGQFQNLDIQFGPNSYQLSAGYHNGEKWIKVDDLEGFVAQAGRDGDIYSVSPDGKFIGGFAPYSGAAGFGGNLLTSVVWDRETGKVLHTFNIAGEKNYTATMRCMSNNGQRGGGWSTRVGEVNYKGGWIPCFWTSKEATDPLIALGGHGSLEGMNNAGTIGVGHLVNSLGYSEGLIMKDDGTFLKVGGDWSCISETGRVAGQGVYEEAIGAWSLDDYYRDLYGLSIESAWYVTGISDNGEYMSLMQLFNGVGFGTVYVRVSGDVLPTKPGKVSLMGGAQGSVIISWEAARFNGYKPIGYNVYRDGVKINEEPVKNVLTYTDATPQVGKNSYTATAVYQYRAEEAIRESEKTDEKSIEVVSETGCYSPKNLEAAVEYNRTVSLSWGNPFPNYNKSGKTDEESVEMVKLQPNILKTFDNMNSAIHSTTDGEFIYGCNVFGMFGKFSLDGEMLGALQVEGGMYRGIAYDGNKLYTTAEAGGSYLATIHSDGSLTGVALGKNISGLTRISYLPFLNGGKGGFEVGAFKDNNGPGTSYYIDMEGKELTGNGNLPQDRVIMGVTYYEDIIYVAEREKHTTFDMKIYLYDAATSAPRNEYIDLRDYPTLQIADKDQIWGVSAMTSSEGIPCLAVLVGQPFGNIKMIFLQLAPMKGLKGYNVWKNNVKITDEPIETTYFSERIFDAGSYEYAITAVFDNACESSKSDPVNVTITPIGTVNAPKNITTEAVRNNIIVSWEAPKASTNPRLVGYNIFRNGVQLNPVGQYVTDIFYTDKDLVLGDYKYEVNAFYNNSGESDKIANTLKLVGFNPTLAPTELVLNKEDRGSVALTWKTPAMGDFEVKTWHNGNIEDCIGVSNEGGILYVATKWDAKDLSSVFNYTLSDIEFYAGNALAYTFYIYADDKLVGEQAIQKAKAKDYNLVKLDNPITIEKGKTLMVACKVTHTAGELPMGISKRNTAIGKGDLTSTDGKNWVSVYESEQFKATWAISVRLMPYSLEAPKEIEGVEMEVNNDKNHKIVGSAVMMRNAATAVFKNSEVIGYNVYKNNEKINSSVVNTEEFKDSSADLTKDNCYSVEALFTADRKSPKSAEVCTFGLCAVPTLTGEIKGNYPELTVTAPTEIVTNDEIKYYGEEGANLIGFGTKDPYYTLLSFKPTDLQEYDSFKIAKIKAYIANNDCSISLFAKQGDKIILNQVIKKSDIQKEMNEWVVTSDVAIDKNSGLLIGLKITAPINMLTLGIDEGPAINYKSNVVSFDEGVTCISLSEATGGQLAGNWNITLSLEKKLPIEEAYVGYNVYRNGVKINEEPVIDELYVDKTVEENTKYTYHATAIWDTKCESKASNNLELTTPVGVDDLASANIKVYPNPVKDMLHIEGDIDAVRLYNSVGQLCGTQTSEGGKLSVDVSNWAKGVYIIEITSTTGEVNRGKVIIK